MNAPPICLSLTFDLVIELIWAASGNCNICLTQLNPITLVEPFVYQNVSVVSKGKDHMCATLKIHFYQAPSPFQRHTVFNCTPIAFNERVTFWLQSPLHCLVRVRLLHCMHVQLRNGYTRAYVQIMQHTYTLKAVTRRVDVKKLLSR